MPPSDSNVVQLPEHATSVAHAMRMLRPFLDAPDVTELAINEPGEVWLLRSGGWERQDCPGASFTWLENLARYIATYDQQRLGEDKPLLSAQLFSGERVEITYPPACPPGTIYFNFRKHVLRSVHLRDYVKAGCFDHTALEQSAKLTPAQREALEAQLPHDHRSLLDSARADDWELFFSLAVPLKKTNLVSGATGSGKTTFARALTQFIPANERIVTMEDVRELDIDHIPNRQHLLYKRDAAEASAATPKKLMESALRKTPSRVLPAELRGDEAYFFLQNVLNSGHPGAITTIHASSPKLAFLRLALMIQTSAEGRALPIEILLKMIYSLIDIVVQIHFDEASGKRSITGVYYDSAYQLDVLG
jgi:type IV secretion system protein VirB11